MRARTQRSDELCTREALRLARQSPRLPYARAGTATTIRAELATGSVLTPLYHDASEPRDRKG